MKIEKLSSETGNKYAAVTLGYDDVRDIANGLYTAAKHDSRYKKIHSQMQQLFELVKTGVIFAAASEEKDEQKQSEKSCDVCDYDGGTDDEIKVGNEVRADEGE